MANKNGGDIKFRVGFQVNQASLNELRKSLQDLQKIKPGDFKGSYQEFTKVKETVSQLEVLMNKAFNPTLNTSNIASFRSELEKSGLSLKQIQSDLSQFGPAGQRAFNQMTTSVLTTNLKLKETNSLIDSMGKTMVNTVKWGIASSVMNTFTQSVQGAFQYVQSLEKSLTNIRIVTGDSTEKMAQFAEQANRSAQALGRSTLDYSKASLKFYQQGLNDEDVQARTEATLKAQNITGAGAQMANYLTSVWNGYKVANEEAELYVDKLAAVADSSASDMSQLAVAMSKVASTANNMGVDVDQLNAQIATVVATTRQAPEAVGTAFKTIYTRMNDIKAGSDEAEISLGNYSGKMAELGVNVLDATGHLRDTGQVMDQIGERWSTMTKEQQVYLAQTMGGQRQVNQLMALFDNWTTYSELLNTSLEAEGTLAEKNARYMESLGAKMEQLGAAGERVKAALIDSDSMKSVIDVLTSATNLAANLFETMGSGNTVLLAFGSSITQLFSGTIAKEINSIITNMQNVKSNAEAIRQELELTKEVQQIGKDTPGGTIVTDRLKEIQQYYSVLDQASINNYKNLLRQRGAVENEIQAIETEQKKVIDLTNAFKQGTVGKEDFVDPGNFGPLNDAIGDTQSKLRDVKDLFSKNLFENWNKIENIQDAQKLVNAVKAFREEYQKINSDKAKQLLNDLNKLNDGSMSPERFGEKLQGYLASADTQAKQLTDTINNSVQALSNATGKASSLDSALKQDVNSAKQLFDVTNAVKFIGAMGQISSTLMTIKNLGSILSDSDVSTGEKIAKILTTAGFVVPTLVSAYKVLKTSSYDLLKNEAIRLATLKLQTAELKAQAVAEAAKKGQGSVGDAYKVGKEIINAKKHLEELKNNATQSTAIVGQGLVGIGSSLISILPVLVAIGTTIGLIVAIYKEWNKEVDAAKKANEIAADTKKTYDDLKTSLQDVKSALDDLHSAEENLDGLTKGTQEWRDALQQCNDKVLELISNYPELAQYVTNENGQLKLNAEGEQAYLDQLQAGVQNARNASYIASSDSRNANARAAAADIGHNSIYTYDEQGAVTYASADQVLKVTQAIDKVVGEGDDLKNGLSGLTDEISAQTGISEEVVGVILSNEDAVLQLKGQLEQNAIADKVMYEAIAANALQGNSKYEGMDQFGKQVANTIAGSDLKDAVKASEDKWMGIMQNQMSRFTSGSTRVVQQVLQALNDVQGTNWKMDSNAVRGGANDRTLAFIDEQGKLRTFTAQQIASTIAVKEALQGLGTSAENASKILNNIDNQVSDNAQEAIKQWVAGQDMTATNRTGLEQLEKGDIVNLLGGQDAAEQLAKSMNLLKEDGTGDIDALRESWSDSCKDMQAAFDNVAQGASKTVQNAFSSIKDSEGLKNATLDFQQMVVGDMQKALAKDSTGNLLKNVTDFYSKIKDFEKFDDIINDFDFSKGSEELKRQLEEIGAIDKNISLSNVEAFVNLMKEASQVSPEQNYKAVHDITDKLEKGDSITAEQGQILKTAGVNVDSFFSYMADGSLKLKANAETFQNYVNGVTMEPFKAKIDDLQKKINDIDSFQGKTNSFEDISGVAADTSSFGGVTVATNQNKQKLENQLEFLNLLDLEQSKQEQINDIQARKNNLSIEDYRTIAQLVEENAGQYQLLNERQAEHLQNIKILKEEMATALDPGLDQDVDETKWENLTEHLQEYADQIPEISDELKDNADVAEDVAEAMLRYDSAIGKVQKSYDDWLKALSSGSIQDQVQATEDLENIYSDLLDLPFDNVLSQNFLQDVDNLNLLKQAANGSEQAYDALMQKAQQDIESKISLDDTQFWTAKDNVTTAMDQMNFQNIQIGADLDTGNFISQLENMVNAAGMSAEQATDYLASMGIDAQVEEIDSSDTETKQSTGYTANLIPHTQHGTFPAYPEGAVAPTQVDTTYTTYSQEVSPQTQTSEDLKENKAFTLKVKSAHKSSGGGFKYKNSSAGNKGGSGGKGKGKGGGGGKGSKPKAAKTVDGASKQKDRYRNVNVRAKKQADSLEKLKKQQEQLTGKDVTKNLNKQLDILKQQEKTIRSKLALQRQERDQLQNELSKYGAKFDKKTGTLNNYGAVFDKITKQYNKVVAWYNGLTGDQQDQQNNKTRLDNAKKAYDQAMKNLERYDKLNEDEIQNSIKELNEKIQEEIDNQVQTFHIKIDAALDFTQARNNYQDFLRDIKYQIRDDDIIGQNKYTFNKLGNYYNKNQTGSIQQLRQQLDDAINNRGGIYTATTIDPQTGKVKKVTDKAKQQADIKDLTQKLQKQLENYQDLIEDIKNSIFDIIDETDKAFKEQIDEYEYISDLIDHNVKVTQLLFGDDAYAQLERYYDKIEENNNAQLDFLRQRQQMWYGRMMQEQARMQSLDPTSNLYKEAQDRFKEYEKLWMESQKDLNSLVEKSIQDLQDKYANSIDNIFTQLELKWTKGLHLDTIEDEWDKINDLADMYLDKINGMYQIDKLENAFQDAIDNASDSLSAQQSLNELMNEQLGYLRDKDKLTQYDVDRANALLQIEIKRLALEQSRSNKTKLRLRRDSQGNYSYQYVANQQENNKAQQELADAQNSLYNTTKEATRNNLSDITKTVQEAKDKLAELYKDQNRDTEEWQIKKANLEQYYTNKINGLLEQNNQLRNDLMQDSFDQLAKMYGINAEQFNAMTEQQKNSIITNLFPQWGSLAQQMADTLKAEGGFYQTIVGPIQEAAAANKDYYDGLNKIQLSSGQAFGAIITGEDSLISKGEALLDSNAKLVDSWEGQIKAIQGTINKVNELSDAYINAKTNGQTIFQEITKGYQKGSFASDLSILGTTGTADSTARKNEYYNQYGNVTKESQSASDLKDYKDYQPESYTITNMRQLLKENNLTSSSIPGVLSSFDSNNKANLKTLIETTVDLNKQYNNINLDSILTSMDNKISNINLNIERLLADNINKLSEIKEVLVNNNNTIEQKVDIQATFPSLVEIKTIQDAFDNLVNRAAQSAGKNSL